MILDTTDIQNLESRYRAQLINSLSGFKSANLVGTCDADKNTNLAIVSSLVHLGAHPPLQAMIMRPHSVPRHTLENIIETGYYTINHVNTAIYEQAHQTSARYPKEVSEFQATGLSEEWLSDFPAPFVAQSHIKLGMKFREQHHLAINNTEMVIGEIVTIQLPEDIIGDDGTVAIETMQSVTISGLNCYHSTELLSYLPYPKPEK